ncbi:response regulator [Butyrivibrio sp. AE3004]|uniref:response regulator n=1 Tax=Butyrivibrio sp. AE3004 TaxID=1506994 RepID=UPI0004942FA9|nr:response regulator [Butyrivibrio sp. AE3004]
MGDKNDLVTKKHNAVIIIITTASMGVLLESILQGWEFWMPPLIFLGIIICWGIHVRNHLEMRLREKIYISFSMLVAFYHGAHATGFYDAVIFSMLLMVTTAMLKREEFLIFIMGEFFAIMLMQIIYAVGTNAIEFNSIVISRLVFQGLLEICCYRALKTILKSERVVEDELESKYSNEETDSIGLEDFLVNISHELRTPVNVINGMTTLILKKERSDDVIAIRNAGVRLSQQIEDIQDYSEIQRGDARLEEDRYEISSVLNDIVANYNIFAKNDKIEFVIDLDPNLPACLRGDSVKIRKIMDHLLDNAFKFTSEGGVYLKISGIKKDYGINLTIEVSDTGIGMTESDIERITRGRYQVNKRRNRSTGGIGLGLSIVFGFARLMKGFVSIESERRKGTCVRVSIAQEIIDHSPCMSVADKRFINIAFYFIPNKYKYSAVNEYYKALGSNFAAGLRLNLYGVPSLTELKRYIDRGKITHVFIGIEEYDLDPEYFETIAQGNITVAVSSRYDFLRPRNSGIIRIAKPASGYQMLRVLNGDIYPANILPEEGRPVLDGLRALIVDDEPMNLVVASGLFKEYKMNIEVANSGAEAIAKYSQSFYDIIFMDHMMPEMDGIEAMKELRKIAAQNNRSVCVIALTANAISGAREMFLKEGFDGFISKPINLNAFERVMNRILRNGNIRGRGGAI